MPPNSIAPELRPKISLRDGLCCIDFVPGTRVDQDMVEYVFHQRLRLMPAGVRRQKLLVHGNRVLALDYAASRLSASRRIAETVTACAVISESALERGIAALFSNLFRPPYPFRLFQNAGEAERWLASFPDD
jgi:hypothetical protein